MRESSRAYGLAMRRLALLALVAVAVLAGCGGGGAGQAERDRAVIGAMQAYRQAKAAGAELDHGPCIAERLPGLPDWVADVAHSPREPIDDVPANSASATGTARRTTSSSWTPRVT